MKTAAEQQARFDARLPKDLKAFLEKAASIAGFRSLTDFVISSAEEKAKEIIREREQIIASERDAQVFFDAITNHKKPSRALKGALKDYNDFMAKKAK